MRLLLAASFGLAVAAVVVWTRPAARIESPRLSWVATARQLGPVSYRDPAGAISPDGKWIAYSEGRFMRTRPVNGGPSVEFPPGPAQIRHLAWSPDNHTILADGEPAPAGWAAYDRLSATRRPLWQGPADGSRLRQLTWSPDGRLIAGIVNGRDGNELWTTTADGARDRSTRIDALISFPAWTPAGEIACIATAEGRSRVTIPCGGPPLGAQPELNAYGPLAFSPDGKTAYVSLANASGTVDLWAVPTSPGRARRLTSFSRDSYAPTVAADGSVVFKIQNYRTLVALADAAGGASRPLATFQSETPSWDPSGKWVGLTFGTWRRVPDDARYPDIAQDVGIIASDQDQPAAAPFSVVHASTSEDQSLCWSPNGRWIAFHSHKDLSDDLWLRRAAGDPQVRRLTTLGRGTEAGWPRWSRDGHWLLFTGASRQTHRTVAYLVGIDQETGDVTAPPKAIDVRNLDVDVFHAEWGNGEIVAIGREGPGRHVIFTVSPDGGDAHIVHRFSSEHDMPGLGVSPDGKDAAFVAPASDGFFQIFRMTIAGGSPAQVTRDPSNKTQPAWSPDGQRIAFTVWSYDAQFWRLEPR